MRFRERNGATAPFDFGTPIAVEAIDIKIHDSKQSEAYMRALLVFVPTFLTVATVFASGAAQPKLELSGPQYAFAAQIVQSVVFNGSGQPRPIIGTHTRGSEIVIKTLDGPSCILGLATLKASGVSAQFLLSRLNYLPVGINCETDLLEANDDGEVVAGKISFVTPSCVTAKRALRSKIVSFKFDRQTFCGD